MNFVSLCAPRVAEERKRLKLSQEAAATACAVSREMWGKYERGTAAMGGDSLLLFSQAGADIRYIVTGDRDAPPPEVLSADERYLLERYRSSPQPLKDAALRVLLGGAPHEQGKVKKQVNVNAAGGQAAGRDIVNKGAKS